MGLTNPRSVSNAWTAIKKKIAEFDKKDRKERGLPSEDEAEHDNGDGEDANPTPKKRARTAKTAAAGGTTPRSRGKAAAAGGSAKKAGRGGKKAAGGLLTDANDAAAAAEAGEEQDDEALKEEAGMIKLEREVDEDGVESYVSGEI